MTGKATIPKLCDDVRFRVIDGEAVVVRQNEGEILVLNGVGSRILELTDGERSIQTIVDLLAAEYDVEESELETDVVAFLDSLQKSGIAKQSAP